MLKYCYHIIVVWFFNHSNPTWYKFMFVIKIICKTVYLINVCVNWLTWPFFLYLLVWSWAQSRRYDIISEVMERVGLSVIKMIKIYQKSWTQDFSTSVSTTSQPLLAQCQWNNTNYKMIKWLELLGFLTVLNSHVSKLLHVVITLLNRRASRHKFWRTRIFVINN